MPSKKPLVALRVSDELYAALRVAADRDGRSIGNYVDMHLRRYFMANGVNPAEVPPARPGRRPGPSRPGRQVDIETAIAAAVKRGPVKAAKHK